MLIQMRFAPAAIGALACVLFLSSASRADLADGLVSYWPFDSNLNDHRDDNHGTLMGTSPAVSLTPGQFGNGIDLDGVDQFVQVTGGDESEFDFTGGDVSISAWFRVDGFTKNWQALIAKGEGSNWRVARRGGDNVMSYAGGTGDIPGSAIGPDVTDGALHHLVAITENGVSTRLYVDGGLVETGGVPTLSNNDMRVQIGDNPDTGNRSWDGLIDDVGIWSRALSEDEVGTIFSSGASIGRLSLRDVTAPGDVIELANGMNDGDGNDGPPPGAEGVENAINNVTQKYLNFLDLGSGFTVTPAAGSTRVNGLRLYTANDAIPRDPASYLLEGSNDGGGTFTVISQGDLALPDDRNPGGQTAIDGSQFNQTLFFDNDNSYTSYRLTFPTLKDAGAANSMQIAEVELLGVPEPTTVAMGFMGLVWLSFFWRRRR